MRQEFDYELPEGLEPHWIAPGSAVYWKHQFASERVEETSDDGRRRRKVIEVDKGWAPTSPLPAVNASQIVAYLKKGLRLRPPQEGVDVEALEAAVPAAALAMSQPEEEKEPARTFICERHGWGKRLSYATWKGYVRHCARFNEPMEEAVPAEVAEHAKGFKWFCFLHNTGFTLERLAKRHLTVMQRRRQPHITLEQMKVS